ncbi:MAG: P-II family nitrogen regulator [Planctomycetes bacterium]|nr:P-II family nitrogen regulator [Planctomycetota bacterium]
MFKKIEGFIQPSTLVPLQKYLASEGVEGISVMEVRGAGTRSRTIGEARLLEPRLKLEIVVREDIVERVITALKRLATAGDLGEGMLFVLPVEHAVRTTNRRREAAAAK